jgi:rubredoxin
MTVAAGRGVAGAASMVALYVRLPPSMSEVGATTTQLWICTSCGYVYDPAEGDPDGGIPAGTDFEEIPDSWFCPVCGARKADFEKYED